MTDTLMRLFPQGLDFDATFDSNLWPLYVKVYRGFRGGATTPPLRRDPVEDRTSSDSPAARDISIESVRSESPAVAMFDDLHRWLGVPYHEVASIVGWRSPSLFFHWKRAALENTPVRPRAATILRLAEVHALLSAVAHVVEGGDGRSGSWLPTWVRRPDAAGMTPLQLLEEGRHQEFAAVAHRFVVPLRAPERIDPAIFEADPIEADDQRTTDTSALEFDLFDDLSD